MFNALKRKFDMGFTAKRTGTSPLTLKGSLGKKLSNYDIYGQSEQNTIDIDGTKYKIPDGYTLLDYATSDGTVYIDTGYVVNYTDLTLKYKFLKTTKLNLNPIGVDIGTVPRLMHGNIWQTSLYYGDTVISTVSNLALDTVYDVTFEISNALGYGKWTINGTDYYVDSKGLNGWTDENTFTNTTTDYLFATNNGTQPRYQMIGNLYYARYYKNNTELDRAFYFLKKDSDSSVVCYDFVTKTFPTITGTLTAGTEAPSPSQPVEIESCGDYVGQKNQLVDPSAIRATQTINGVTFTNNNDGSYSVNGTATANALFISTATDAISLTANHVIYLCGCATGASTNTYSLRAGNSTFEDVGNGAIFTYNGINTNILIRVMSGVTISNKVFKPQFIDLTQMFGTGNEPATVADAKAKIAEVMGGEQDYYAYNAGSDYYKIPVIAGSNCGMVDLGTLNWNRSTSYSHPFFYLSVSDKASGSISNGFISKYPYTSDWSVGEAGVNFGSKADDKSYALCSVNNQIFIRDDSYTSITAFKQAMSGVYFYYQRATDTSWTTPTTTNIYLDEPLRKVRYL